jgi:hypothetical protein
MRGILKMRWDRGASPKDQSSGNSEIQSSRSADRELPRNTTQTHSIASSSALCPHRLEMFGVYFEGNEHLN